jgi:elongation factor P
MGCHFMNNETFDQTIIQKKLIDNPHFLQEGMQVDILFHAEKEVPLTLELPQSIVAEISYTEPGVKGDTATNTLKPAKIETPSGEVEIKVPLFINLGDKVRIDTRSGAYVERVKE